MDTDVTTPIGKDAAIIIQRYPCARRWIILSLLLGCSSAGVFAQRPPSNALEFKVRLGGSQRLSMYVNSSKILVLEGKQIPRVLVNNPNLVSAIPISPNQIQLSGLKAGVTSINLWDEDTNPYSIDVIVFGDAKELQFLLETEFPNASIRVRPLQTSVVLSGWVDGPEVISRVVRMAEDYYPSVINNIRVGDNQQVMLHTRVMEVSRTKLRQLGLDWANFGSSSFVVQTVSGLIQEFDSAASSVTSSADASSITFGILNGNNQFFGVLDALRQNDLVKVLAEPVLTTVSGRPAVFNAGGEFPILIPQGLGTVAIEYKTFGTRVDFVPTVLGNGNIRLEVRPQVSEIDSARGVDINGTRVPGLRNRWVDTAVEMRAGQTLALAGLIQDRTETQNKGLPWLSDLPWVGVLFRRVQDVTNEIELLVMVRPELVAAMDPEQVPLFGPGEQTVNASDTELFGRGYVEVPACCPDGSCRKCRPGEGEFAIPVDDQRVEVIDPASAARVYGPNPTTDATTPTTRVYGPNPTTDATTPTTMPFGMRPPSPQNVKQPQSNEKNNVLGFNKAFGRPAPVYRKVSDKTPVAPTFGRTKPRRPVTPIERGRSGSSDPGLFGQIGYDVLD